MRGRCAISSHDVADLEPNLHDRLYGGFACAVAGMKKVRLKTAHPSVVLSGRSSSICARTPSSASKASHRSSAASRPRAFNRPFGPFPEQITAGCVHDPNSAADHGHLVVLLIQTCFNRQRAGRARLGEINRAVNLSIRATSDLSQYGVADFWSAPLATIEKGAGECEDYAILKYLALREAGISPDDLRLLIVSDPRRRTIHAVLAVHSDGEWLLLDNLTMVMVSSLEATQYQPLIAFDYHAITTFAAGSSALQEGPAAIQDVSDFPKDLPSRSAAR